LALQEIQVQVTKKAFDKRIMLIKGFFCYLDLYFL